MTAIFLKMVYVIRKLIGAKDIARSLGLAVLLIMIALDRGDVGMASAQIIAQMIVNATITFFYASA